MTHPHEQEHNKAARERSLLERVQMLEARLKVPEDSLDRQNRQLEKLKRFAGLEDETGPTQDPAIAIFPKY